MRTENPPGRKDVSDTSAAVPTPSVLPAVATEVDREFERYRLMRAELRQQSGKWRRAILLERLN
jgi:hypothetical protein